jgi:hypothetical protein
VGFGSAHAGPFIGAKAGGAVYGYDDLDSSFATQLSFGYQPLDGGFGVEASYLDLGEADIQNTNGELNMSGYNLAGTYSFGGMSTGSNFVVRVGSYFLDTELSGPGGSVTEESNGLSMGVGMGFHVSEQFVLAGDIDTYIGVDDFADDESVTAFSVAAQYHF